MAHHRPRRHLRARPPAAARGAARVPSSSCPSCSFPSALNCATELLDRHVARRPRRAALRAARPAARAWTYAELQRQADRIAHVLVDELGLVPGNRVLLRAANKPMLVACWFAVMKAGGIAVGDDAAAARQGARRRSSRRRRSTHRALRRGAARRARRARPRVRRCSQRIVCFGDDDRGRRPRGAHGAPRRDRSPTSTPPPTTPACSPSPPAPPASRRRRCTSTAT